MAFLKSPVGQMFHQFFGENMLRADVCNSVDELGQLLDHTGPICQSERNAARIFNADHCFFVTNGTSTSNKMVWHHTVAPGDVVVVDRNCHKSHPALDHHDRRGAGVPDARRATTTASSGRSRRREFSPEAIRKKIAANPLLAGVDAKKVKPRILTLTQSTYDGVLYNTETIKHALDGYIDTLHFDEAWLPHAAFHTFYGTFHAMGRKRPRPKDQLVFATQSTHKLLAGISQASQVLVQDAQNRKLDRHLFNEAYLMHTSTSPQYAIIASCDVAAAMMEAPGGTALVEESITEALDFRRAMRKVDKEYGQRLVVQGLGAGQAGGTRASAAASDWMLKAGDKWHGFGDLAEGFNLLDPIKSTIITPGLDVSGKFAKTGIPAAIVTKFLAEHGVVVEKTGLYSFFIMFTIGITKGRWNTLLTALQQFKDDYDRNAPMWRVLPEFCAAHPRYERMGLRDLCQSIHEHVRQGRHRAADDRDVPVGPAAGDEAQRRLRAHRAPQDRARGDRRAGRPHHHGAADAVSAGHPAADPGRTLQPQDRRLPALHARSSTRRSRASTPTCTAWSKTTGADGQRRYYVDCVTRQGAERAAAHQDLGAAAASMPRRHLG